MRHWPPSARPRPPASAQETVGVLVEPNLPWTDTEITVTAGQPLTITASGVVKFINKHGYPQGPAGDADCLKEKPGPFEAPNLPCFSLIGKIGVTGTPFEVGASYISAASPAGGELFLAPNDDKYPDNGGSWVAILTGGITQNDPPAPPPTILNTSQPTIPPTPPTTESIVTSTIPPPISSAAQAPPMAPPTATIAAGNYVITDSAPAVVHGSAQSGILAFTGFGPLEQMITLFGVLFLLVGIALYFLGTDARTVAWWLLGL